MKDRLILGLWVLFGLGCIANLIHSFTPKPYQCDCAAINTECGQPGVYSSVKEWENTLEKEPTDAERTALSDVIDGERPMN